MQCHSSKNGIVGWPGGQLNKCRFKQYFLGAKLLFLPNQLLFLLNNSIYYCIMNHFQQVVGQV